MHRLPWPALLWGPMSRWVGSISASNSSKNAVVELHMSVWICSYVPEEASDALFIADFG